MNYVYVSSVVMTCNTIILMPNFGQKEDRRPQEYIYIYILFVFLKSFFSNISKKQKKHRENQNKRKETKEITFQRSWILGKPQKPRGNKKT